jgi:hypothetical protein
LANSGVYASGAFQTKIVIARAAKNPNEQREHSLAGAHAGIICGLQIASFYSALQRSVFDKVSSGKQIVEIGKNS